MQKCFLILIILYITIVAAFAQTPVKIDQPDGATQQIRNDIIPLVDYHVHLLGPYALPDEAVLIIVIKTIILIEQHLPQPSLKELLD
jgi:hypothetical protein